MLIDRQKTHRVTVGGVVVGGCAPIVVQSMTDTQTADVDATLSQIRALVQAGSEMVRVTVDTEEAAAAIGELKRRMIDTGVDVPLIGDFHYIGHQLLRESPSCAEALDKYRVNPGNVGFGEKRDERFKAIIDIAVAHDTPVRIGVNGGSLDQDLLADLMDANARLSNPQSANQVTNEAMVASALRSAEAAEQYGLAADKIILSAKVSKVQDLILVYRMLAERGHYALHLGLTEAGMGMQGTVSSTAALAVLLQEGIGDTIRVSLTPDPGAERTQEVYIAQQILQVMGIRSFMPQVTACPGCGRTSSDYFQTLAMEIQTFLQRSMPAWREEYPGVEDLSVAVMGCIVNGPGESKSANIGISLPGKKEDPRAPVYVDGEQVTTLQGDTITADFTAMVTEYVERNYGAGRGTSGTSADTHAADILA